MRKALKLIAILTIIATMLTLVAGCGGKGTADNTEEPSTQAASTAESSTPQTTDDGMPDMTKKISFTIATPGSNVVDNDAKYIKLMEEKYNFDIEVLPCYGDEYTNQVKMLLASGDIPDVIKLKEGLPLADLVSQDLIAELKLEDIQKYMPRYYAEVTKYSDQPFKFAKIDGKIYAIISQNPDGDYHFTCIWRKDWLENVGITKVPETLDEYYNAFVKFSKNDPDKNGKADTYGLSDRGMTPIYGAFGYLPYRLEAEYYAEENGQIIHSASQPVMKEALKLLNKWYNEGLIDPEFLTGERTTGHWSSSQAFAMGRIGFTSTGMYYNTGRESEFGRDGRFWKLFRETQDGLGITTSDFVHGRPPIGPDGKSGNLKWGVEEGPTYVFNKDLEQDPDKFHRILMWYDDMNFDLDNWLSAQYGIKGEDWNYDEATKTVSYGLSDATRETARTEDWAPLGLGYLFINDYIEVARAKDYPGYQFADKVANFTEGYTDPIDSAPLVNRAKYDAELVKLTVTSYTDMITGKKPIDTYFDQYVKEWESMGGAEVLKEANEWWAKNAK